MSTNRTLNYQWRKTEQRLPKGGVSKEQITEGQKNEERITERRKLQSGGQVWNSE
jgi:hypothetical protein